MTRDERRRLTKEIGLEAQYRVLKYLFKTEHLHYGLFEPDIPRDIWHLKDAQERYLQRLTETIPPGVRSILDVGCGTGATAEHLLAKGYAVDCVSPGAVLTEIAAQKLGDRARIFRGRFEDVAIPARYDLVLFSESFQYVPMEAALDKCLALLNPGGHILICDFFHDETKGRAPIGGGHHFGRWREVYAARPLDLITGRDITEETAPLHDIAQEVMTEVVEPLWHNSLGAADARWPWISRAGRVVFRKAIDRMERRRLSRERNAAAFRHYKRYMTYLFRTRMEPVHPTP
jgi:SAM-dependent methyltransferase